MTFSTFLPCPLAIQTPHPLLVPSCMEISRWRVNQNKTTGLEDVGHGVLRAWVEKLWGINRVKSKVSVLWKTYCPVPKKISFLSTQWKQISFPNIMKVLENMLVPHLSRQVSTLQDPLQFAYCSGVWVEDVIFYPLHQALPHLLWNP